jgi:hypothetical protein
MGHLAACADCRAEWALVTVGTRLGASVTPPGDPALLAASLLVRLDHERAVIQRRLRIWTAAGLAAAAGVIIAIWTGAVGGVPSRQTPGGPTPRVATAPATPSRVAPTLASSVELPLPEIDDLPAEALDSMLQVLDEPAARADVYQLPGLGDAGDRELERALTGLEG